MDAHYTTPIILAVQTTPAAPPDAGYFYLYGKSDGKLYGMNAAGVEKLAEYPAANEFLASTDPRLTDARTPLTHSHSPSDITGTAVVTSDSRLSDARTPTTHTHAADAWFTSAQQTKQDLDAAQFPTPTTGQTQTFNILKKGELIACNHVATIAAQTFVFPTDANSAIGQELRIFSRSIITTVTLTLNANTIVGLALTTLPANGNAAWRKVAASTWVRIQ